MYKFLIIFLFLLLTSCLEQPKKFMVLRSPVITPTIMTPIPPEKRKYFRPNRYTFCKTVKGCYPHQVCYYKNLPSHLVWIDGHWHCTRYLFGSCHPTCLNWQWQKPRPREPYVMY